MRPFSTSVLEVTDGAPHAFKPVSFDGHVSEAQLESWVVDNPELVGEPLLVLGQQLADFEEDQDRLDVLAIDADGELVLIELKVTDIFRVTDLQALAYAGAYASREPGELAQTLRRTMQKRADASQGGGAAAEETPAPSTAGMTTADGSAATDPNTAVTQISLDESKERIVGFLELDDFDAWQPSQHVRIKLVAPTFPRRVLKTVKWRGDVYNMPIEAIAVRLFRQGSGQYSLTFERLLPLPDEGEFDMPIRRIGLVGCALPREMELVEALSNPETQERLVRLSEKLAKIAASGAAPRSTARSDRRLRSGLVPEAIMRVLSESVEPMRMKDIHAEVEQLLDRSVTRSAVKNWLANHVQGDHALFVRLGRGRYLATPTHNARIDAA